MRTVEIISHCWRYSRALTYQLSSLVLNPPKRVRVYLFVFCHETDRPTMDVLKLFSGPLWSHLNADDQISPRLIYIYPLNIGMILNRSICRDLRAKMTEADLVWFCDCDYFFGPGCLDALADVPLDPAEEGYSPLYYPRVTFYNKDHANGDAYSLRAAVPGVYDIDPADFVEHRPRRAIGGIQIVPGDVARREGYCPNHRKWQTPCDTWKQTGADRVFRKILGTNGKPIDMPNCYRIRQSTEGVVDTLEISNNDDSKAM